MRTLFIGNSFTFYNDMPEIFKNIAKAAGIYVSVSTVTKGSYTLENFADIENEYGKLTDLKSEEKWDVLILQEQSKRPIIDKTGFLTGAASLSARFKPNAGKIFFYVTFPYKLGHSFYASSGLDPISMGNSLIETYEEVGCQLDIECSPAGNAFLYSLKNHPEIQLYNDDKVHPSLAGSYLVACVHFAKILNTKAYGNESIPQTLDRQTALKLQKIADTVVFEKENKYC